MSPLPHDFDPKEEQEVYDIFGALRREVYDAIKDLATQIFARIQLEQEADERTVQPDLLQVIEQSLLNLFQVIVDIFQPRDQENLLDQEEQEQEDQAVPPIVRSRRNKRSEDE